MASVGLDQRRALVAAHLEEVRQPLPSLEGADISHDLVRAERAVEMLRHTWQSDQSFMASTALEHVVKALREPGSQFTFMYRFNALQNCDSLESRLTDLAATGNRFDKTHYEDFLMLLAGIRLTLEAASAGNIMGMRNAFSEVISAAVRIGSDKS